MVRREVKRKLETDNHGYVTITPLHSHADIMRYIVDDVGPREARQIMEDVIYEGQRQKKSKRRDWFD